MKTGQIKGRVVDKDGHPVVEAVVMITADSPSHIDIAALTNDQGAYQLNDLEPGEYVLSVNTESFGQLTKSTKVNSNEITTLNFNF